MPLRQIETIERMSTESNTTAQVVGNVLITALLLLAILFVQSCLNRQPAKTGPTTSSPSPSAANSPTSKASPENVSYYHGSGIVTKVVREKPLR